MLHILENGDHLTRDEFESLCTVQGIEYAELINGVVHMAAAAVRFHQHGSPHARIMTWLGSYAAEMPNVEVADNTTVRLDDQNEPQPDALMIYTGEQAQTRIADDGYLEGPPELVVEIAASSASVDAHEKLGVYQRSGVREYLLWRTEEQTLDWYTYEFGEFRPMATGEAGLIHSRVFPGLCLDCSALLSGDMKQVLQRLRNE